jgi:hypothetical protein
VITAEIRPPLRDGAQARRYGGFLLIVTHVVHPARLAAAGLDRGLGLAGELGRLGPAGLGHCSATVIAGRSAAFSGRPGRSRTNDRTCTQCLVALMLSSGRSGFGHVQPLMTWSPCGKAAVLVQSPRNPRRSPRRKDRTRRVLSRRRLSGVADCVRACLCPVRATRSHAGALVLIRRTPGQAPMIGKLSGSAHPVRQSAAE